MDESRVKVYVHVDGEDLVRSIKLDPEQPSPDGGPGRVTLRQLKSALAPIIARKKFKLFFETKDDDFGVVKEEITDDSSVLPYSNGKIICWLEMAAKGTDTSSNVGFGATASSAVGSDDLGGGSSMALAGIERAPGVGETRPPSFHGGIHGIVYESESNFSATNPEDGFDDTESSITSVSQAAQRRRMEMRMRQNGAYRDPRDPRHARHRPGRLPGPGIPRPGHGPESASLLTSEMESSLYDDEDDDNEDEMDDGGSLVSSRVTTSTDHTSVSQVALRNRQKKRSKRRNQIPPHLARAGSMSSITDSTMSLNCITVTLNLDTVTFLGISIVGQSNRFGDGGDCGIYVGSIMKGGAVALDGRIEPGDMILQVNDISFENMTNDDAVRVLRKEVQKPGPIKLVVAKSWESTPRSYFTVPKTEPVRPIDPGAWVAHTAAVRGQFHMPTSHFGPQRTHGEYPGRYPSVQTLSGSSVVSSQAETIIGGDVLQQYQYNPYPHQGLHSQTLQPPALPPNKSLSASSSPLEIARAMAHPDSKLDIRTRTWLKLEVRNAFLGSDAVDWIAENVNGLSEKKDARKMAGQMLKAKLVRNPLGKSGWCDESYYTFAEEATSVAAVAAGLSSLRMNSHTSPPAPTVPAPPVPHASGSGWTPTAWNPHPPKLPRAPNVLGHGTMDETSSLSGSNYVPIYNPMAPPPSATAQFSVYEDASEAYTLARQPSSAGSGSHHLRLAGSGSGSESDSGRMGSSYPHQDALGSARVYTARC